MLDTGSGYCDTTSAARVGRPDDVGVTNGSRGNGTKLPNGVGVQPEVGSDAAVHPVNNRAAASATETAIS